MGLSPACVDRVEVTWSRSDRGVSFRMRPTWVGVRPYTTTDGAVVRVLRRPRQVNSPGHLETMKRLTVTRGHPRRGERRVFLSAAATPGTPAPWDPDVELRPHQEYFEGSVGDSIVLVDVPGLGRVPEFETTIVGVSLLTDVRAGGLEVSYGYVSFFLDAVAVPVESEIPEDGWQIVGVGFVRNPITGEIEPFDVEGILDPTDPRMPDDLREFAGGNHVAAGLGRVGGSRGRGGPEVRLLPLQLDQTDDPPCRMYALTAPESASAVAFILTSGADEAPCTALWMTDPPRAVAYDSLASMRALHAGDYATDAMTELELGWPEKEPALAGGERDTMAEVPPIQAPPNGAPNSGPPGGDQVAMLTQKVTALEGQVNTLLAENAALKAENTSLKAQVAAAEDDKVQADTAKAKAEAAADSLREELTPHRTAALKSRREAGAKAIGATGELADKIKAASADELDGLVVRAHYDAHPELRAATDGLEQKLVDPAYLAARFDALVEQTPRAGRVAGASDAFRESFAPRVIKGGEEKKTMQQRLDERARGGEQC